MMSHLSSLLALELVVMATAGTAGSTSDRASRFSHNDIQTVLHFTRQVRRRCCAIPPHVRKVIECHCARWFVLQNIPYMPGMILSWCSLAHLVSIKQQWCSSDLILSVRDHDVISKEWVISLKTCIQFVVLCIACDDQCWVIFGFVWSITNILQGWLDGTGCLAFWQHHIMTSSNGSIFHVQVVLTHCVRNSPVTGDFPSQRPVARSFDVFFDLRLNKRLSKQSRSWRFETPSRSLWRHSNAENYPWSK